MTHTEESKEAFYDEHHNVFLATQRKDKLILLGDFNARVGGGSNHLAKGTRSPWPWKVQLKWPAVALDVCLS